MIDDAFPAVTVPSFWNAGRKRAQLGDVAPPGLLVVRDDYGRSLALRDLDRNDLAAELALRDGALGAAVRLGRERVLIRARDPLFLGAQLGAVAHVHVAVRVPQAIL